MKKVLKGKHFLVVKAIEIDEFKTCSEQWKKVSLGVLHQMESTLKGTEVYTHKNKYTIFINKFQVFKVPPPCVFFCFSMGVCVWLLFTA